MIASDGSSNRTAEIAAQFADNKRIRVLAYPENRGKLHVPRLFEKDYGFPSPYNTYLHPGLPPGRVRRP